MNRSDYVELRWVFSVMRRRWWFILAFTIIVTAGTYLISSRIPPIFRASTTMLVQQASGSSFSDYNTLRASEQLALTYSKMVNDWQVMETVINRLDLDMTPRTLASRVSAEGIPDTQLFMLSVDHNNPALVAQIADTIAEVFIEQIQTEQEQRFTSLLSGMQEQISEILTMIDETEAQIDALSVEGSTQGAQPTASPETNLEGSQAANEVAYLQANLAVYRSTYATLHRNYEQMRLDVIQATPFVIVVEKALTPLTPVFPRIDLYTILAGVVALMLAIGLVFLLEYLDDTIKTPEDVTRSLGLVTIGIINKIKKGEDGLVMIDQPLSPVAEAFRLLRANIRFLSNEKPLHTLLITSPSVNEGKSFTVSNLAVAMIQAELNVVAVEADLHHSRLYDIFDMQPLLEPRHEKWSKVPLEGNSNGQLHLAHVGRLSVHAGDGHSLGPESMLGSKRIQEQLLGFSKEADMVLVDTPPVLSIADTVDLAQIVDGVLLVVRSGTTRSQVAQRALESLRQAGANPIGVVLTAAPITRDNYYAYREISKKGKRHRKSKSPVLPKITAILRRLIERVRQAFPV